MATIKDVAQRTGLSSATISRVINNQPYVTEETKELVHQAMQELGYTPNISARRLRNQKTDTVAVIIPRLTNPFFLYLFEGMEKVATAKGLRLFIYQTQNNKQRELDFINLLKRKEVDGLILTSYENEWSVLEPLVQQGPVIMCNEYTDHPNIPSVHMDHAAATYDAVTHLIRKGYRKIGYCSYGKTIGIEKERKKGFDQALDEYGLSLNKKHAFIGIEHSIPNGRATLRRIADLPKADRPDAIFTGGDEFAAGMVKEAAKIGWKVPDDLAVVGFDDQPVATLVDPELTTIHQPTEELGKKAMEVLLDVMTHYPSKSQENILLPYELKIRGTT